MVMKCMKCIGALDVSHNAQMNWRTTGPKSVGHVRRW